MRIVKGSCHRGPPEKGPFGWQYEVGPYIIRPYRSMSEGSFLICVFRDRVSNWHEVERVSVQEADVGEMAKHVTKKYQLRAICGA